MGRGQFFFSAKVTLRYYITVVGAQQKHKSLFLKVWGGEGTKVFLQCRGGGGGHFFFPMYSQGRGGHFFFHLSILPSLTINNECSLSIKSRVSP